MLTAALMSRSCRVPQCAQSHSRTPSGKLDTVCPHAEQIFDEGYQRPGVDPGDLEPGLVPVRGAFPGAGQPPLGPREPVPVAGFVPGVGDLVPGREGDQGRDARVDADDRGAGRVRLDRALAQQGHEPASGGVAADGHRGRFRAVRQGPGPYDGQRCGHLGEVQLAVAVPECRPGVRRRPGFLPRLVPGVAGLLLPESGVCGLQVPQGLLERDAGYLVEIAEVVGVFPLGQHRGGLEVGDVFVPLVPRRGAGFEREVPYLTDAAEGPEQFPRPAPGSDRSGICTPASPSFPYRTH